MGCTASSAQPTTPASPATVLPPWSPVKNDTVLGFGRRDKLGDDSTKHALAAVSLNSLQEEMPRRPAWWDDDEDCLCLCLFDGHRRGIADYTNGLRATCSRFWGRKGEGETPACAPVKCPWDRIVVFVATSGLTSPPEFQRDLKELEDWPRVSQRPALSIIPLGSTLLKLSISFIPHLDGVSWDWFTAFGSALRWWPLTWADARGRGSITIRDIDSVPLETDVDLFTHWRHNTALPKCDAKGRRPPMMLMLTDYVMVRNPAGGGMSFRFTEVHPELWMRLIPCIRYDNPNDDSCKYSDESMLRALVLRLLDEDLPSQITVEHLRKCVNGMYFQYEKDKSPHECVPVWGVSHGKLHLDAPEKGSDEDQWVR